MAVYTASLGITVARNPELAAIDDVISRIKHGEPPALGDTLTVPFSNGTTWDYYVVDVDETTGDVTYSQDIQGVWLPDNGTADLCYRKEPKYGDYSYAGATTLRTFLNETWFNLYPSNIKNAIKPKTGRYTVGDISGSQVETATDNVWIPSVNNITLENESSMSQYRDPNNNDKRLAYYAVSSTSDIPLYKQRFNDVRRRVVNVTGSLQLSTRGEAVVLATARTAYKRYSNDTGKTQRFWAVGTSVTYGNDSETAKYILPHFTIGA